jgi:hypothetical protein
LARRKATATLDALVSETRAKVADALATLEPSPSDMSLDALERELTQLVDALTTAH